MSTNQEATKQTKLFGRTLFVSKIDETESEIRARFDLSYGDGDQYEFKKSDKFPNGAALVRKSKTSTSKETQPKQVDSIPILTKEEAGVEPVKEPSPDKKSDLSPDDPSPDKKTPDSKQPSKGSAQLKDFSKWLSEDELQAIQEMAQSEMTKKEFDKIAKKIPDNDDDSFPGSQGYLSPFEIFHEMYAGKITKKKTT
jgi:hypothetical protein